MASIVYNSLFLYLASPRIATARVHALDWYQPRLEGLEGHGRAG